VGFGCVLKVIEDPLDHHRIFDAGDDFYGTAAGTSGLDIDPNGSSLTGSVCSVNTLRPC